MSAPRRPRVTVLGVRGIPNVQGGVETHAEHLYGCLAALGWDIEVIVRTPFVPAAVQSVGVVRLRRIWSPSAAGVETVVHSVLGVLYAAIRRPDLLHIHAVGPAIVTPLARLLGLKVVVTHHGPDYDRDKWGPLARVVLRFGERMGMRFANERIAISRVIVDLIRAKYDKPAHLIPNGVMLADTTPDIRQIAPFKLEQRKYFLQVSRIVPEKRQLELIRAFAAARIPGWRLALVGRIEKSAYCRDVQAAAAETGTVMTGFLSGRPLQQLYANAGIFVLPSSHEGLPIALLEALSYGLPSIASNIPANLEIGLDAANYFALGNLESLADKLTQFALLDESAATREARRQWVGSHYDWQSIAVRTGEVYRGLVAG